MWQVDFARFHQHFRDQLLVSATESKIDKAGTRNGKFVKFVKERVESFPP